MTKKLIPLIIIIACVLIAGVIVYIKYSNPAEQAKQEEGEALSLDQAGEKMINFINNSVLQGQATASLIEALEENGLYKIKFDVEGEQVEWYITKDGNLIFPQVVNLSTFESPSDTTEEQGQTTLGNFLETSDEICLEDGKPVIYFFGSQNCPHCIWEHPIVEQVMLKFEGYISFHNNMDSDADMDVFQKYSTGGIPTIVLGCKYYRVGSGENSGEGQEAKDLTNLVCELTNNQPNEVCQK